MSRRPRARFSRPTRRPSSFRAPPWEPRRRPCRRSACSRLRACTSAPATPPADRTDRYAPVALAGRRRAADDPASAQPAELTLDIDSLEARRRRRAPHAERAARRDRPAAAAGQHHSREERHGQIPDHPRAAHGGRRRGGRRGDDRPRPARAHAQRARRRASLRADTSRVDLRPGQAAAGQNHLRGRPHERQVARRGHPELPGRGPRGQEVGGARSSPRRTKKPRPHDAGPSGRGWARALWGGGCAALKVRSRGAPHRRGVGDCRRPVLAPVVVERATTCDLGVSCPCDPQGARPAFFLSAGGAVLLGTRQATRAAYSGSM